MSGAETMNQDALDALVASLPDQEAEVALLKALEGLDDQQRFETVSKGFGGDDLNRLLSLLRVIKQSVKDQTLLLSVLDVGIRNGKPQEIGYWLNTLMPEAGPKEVIEACSRYVDEDPEIVVAIWDHLSTIIQAVYPDLHDDLVALSSKIDCVKYGFCSPPEEW